MVAAGLSGRAGSAPGPAPPARLRGWRPIRGATTHRAALERALETCGEPNGLLGLRDLVRSPPGPGGEPT
jgi:hypothetical protein